LTTVLGSVAGDGGIPSGELLVEFAEALVGSDDERLARARAELSERLGAKGLVDAAAVVGFFNAIDRVADATGIPLDPERLEATADFRTQLGIDGFVDGRV
jgi:hypothetical protein